MLLTERKAITEIFANLQEEKRQLKQNYRNDLAQIESRENDLLNRLERLDAWEREAVDVEGVLQSMQETASKLAELIPAVPAADMIERAAQIVAKEAKKNGAQITSSNLVEARLPEVTEAIEKEKEYFNYTKESKLSPMEYLQVIADVIRENGGMITARQIQNELKRRYGWEWSNFTGRINYWRNQHAGIIERRGLSYYVVQDHPELYEEDKLFEQAKREALKKKAAEEEEESRSAETSEEVNEDGYSGIQ